MALSAFEKSQHVGKISHAEIAERIRLNLIESMKAEHGQYFTPASLAQQVITGLKLPDSGSVKVLDLGAGVGALTAALYDALPNEVQIEVTAVELDTDLIPYLKQTLDGLSSQVIQGNAIELAYTGQLSDDYDIVIMNPPYGKLPASSDERLMMAAMGVQVPNIYAAFMAIGYMHLREGGQIAAIVPRSWANGPYFKKFRQHLLSHLSLVRLHSYSSRSTLFSEAKVLQENVIITARRSLPQGEVELVFDNEPAQLVAAEVVLAPNDPELFIRIPTGTERELTGAPLSALGLHAATGKVVDFRAKEHLTDDLSNSYPIIYSGNISDGKITWPKAIGKPQGFRCSPSEEAKYLLPPGSYVVIRRFSPKEEPRRIVAAVYEATTLVAYDNKTNVISCPDTAIAVGLAYWLNSTVVDDYFRAFSGHTQVNATDLRALPYPSIEKLSAVGKNRDTTMPDQKIIDEIVEALL